MGTKGIRLKMLLSLIVAIVLAEATGSQMQLDTEINLPAIVFRKEHEAPVKFKGAAFQKEFCAAFSVADGAFLTSAHCLATAPRTKGLDLAGLGNVEIEKIETHPKLDLTVFQLKNRNLIPGSWHVGLNSEILDDACSVLILNPDFRWTVLHGATPTRCLDNASKDKICYKTEKIPAGLDYTVVCEEGRTLHAVFHGQRGVELSFTVCSMADCTEFLKQGATTRVKRQDDADSADKPVEDPDKAKEDPDKAIEDPDKAKEDPDKAIEDPDKAKEDPDKAKEDSDKVKDDSDKAKEDPKGDVQGPKDVETPKPIEGVPPVVPDGSPANDPASTANTGDVPLPPPSQAFPNMPQKFPYPSIKVVQSPPVPTRSRKQPLFQNPYPVQAPKENPFPEIPAVNSMTPDQPTQQIKEQPTHVVANAVDVSVQLPMRTESPETADLTEYEVLGTQDAPVLAANNDVKMVEDPAATHHHDVEPQNVAEPQDIAAPDAQYTVPAAVQQRVQRPIGGGFAMAPADWRYSVTPKPQRRCKTTTSRPACRAKQPSPAEPGVYHNNAAPPMDKAYYPVNYQPMLAMDASAAGAAGAVGQYGVNHPVGQDPWMEAAQNAVPTGYVQPKSTKKATKKPSAPRSSAVRNGLAVVVLIVANALHFMM